MEQNLNLERLDRCLAKMLGSNQPLCRVYTTEEVTNMLLEQRGKHSSYLEFNGLLDDRAIGMLERGGFKIVYSPANNVYRTKTTITW
jgi:hypothetical protein